MKPKLKLRFDKDAIVLFLIEHGEKFVVGGVAVCFLMLTYAALVRPSYSEKPVVLVQAADAAEQNIKKTEPVAPQECQAPDYPEIATISSSEIEEGRYQQPVLWKPPLFKTLDLRGEPPLFTVARLRGLPGRGPFTLNEKAVAAAAGRPRPGVVRGGAVRAGQRWVVVTGLVPIKQQRDAFKEYFSNCQKRDPETDVPKYIDYYQVERAEVTDPEKTDDLNWRPRNVPGLLRWAKVFFASESPEVVNKDFLDPGNKLVFPLVSRLPLGPATFGQSTTRTNLWDEESVAYPPEVPLASAAPKSASSGDSASADSTQPGVAVPGIDLLPIPETHRGGAAAEEDDEPRYWLFRFFDYHVKPDRQYRYRVRLRLRNPSAAVEDRYLNEQLLARKKKIADRFRKKMAEGKRREAQHILAQWQGIMTVWSKPTDVVTVPRDISLLAVSVKPPIRLWGAPSARLKVVKWLNDYGILAYTDKVVRRGDVANFPGMKFPEVAEGKRPDLDQAKTDPGDAVDVDYLTEALAVDMTGGEKLPNDDRFTPGRVLLLDRDGYLVVHDEIEDLPEVEALTRAPEGQEGEAETPAETPAGEPTDGPDIFEGVEGF